MAKAFEARRPLMETRPPELPEAVAKYFDEMQTRVRAQMGNPIVIGFARVQSFAELEQLPQDEFYARWLEASAPRPENYDDGRGPISRRNVIGEVHESPTLVHVVYRIQTDVGRYGNTEETEVITAKHTPDGWRLLMTRDMSSSGSMRLTTFRQEPGEAQIDGA